MLTAEQLATRKQRISATDVGARKHNDRRFDRDEAAQLYQSGRTTREVASAMSVNQSTMWNALNRMGVLRDPVVSRQRCAPLFSSADADLRMLVWRTARGGYARVTCANHRSKQALAHRVVMERVVGRPLRDEELCDHINGDRLDNRRENLRITDRFGNAQNRRPHRNNKSCGLRGATLHKASGKWYAHVEHLGKRIHLGAYETAEKAASVAKTKRIELGFLGESDA